MAATAHPGGSNTYPVNLEATGYMIVSFSRNPDTFALNRYIQVVPVTKDVGLYTEMGVEAASRVLNANLADRLWADNGKRPSAKGNTEKHAFKEYRTKRYSYGWELGWKGTQQASWDIVAQHNRYNGQNAMTARTQLVHNILASGLTQGLAVTAIPGVTGQWDLSTTARKDIERSLDYAFETIMKATQGAITNPADLKLVMAPETARRMKVCQEIVDYIKGSPAAIEDVKGKIGPASAFGLPRYLYGYEVVIENAVKTTNKRGGTSSKSFIMDPDKPMLVARPGSLTPPDTPAVEQPAPNFSTLTLFAYEEMTVEQFDDTKHRQSEGYVTDDVAPLVTAPISGFLFTDALS